MKYLKIVFFSICAWSFNVGQGMAQTQADWIVMNTEVLTMKDGDVRNQAEAVAVKDQLIIGVGSNLEMNAFIGPNTVVKDLNGRCVMPSFVDPHNHIFTDARQLLGSGVSSLERQDLLFEQGITTLGDPNIEDTTITKMLAFEASGEMKVKMNLYLIRNHACDWEVGDWFKNYPVTGDKTAQLRVAGMKIFADGGSCGTFPAVDWILPRGDMGDLFLTDEEMDDYLTEAHTLGYQVVIHAQGNRAIKQAQERIDQVLFGAPNVLRHRIDHNAFLSSDVLDGYKRHDIIPVCFAHFPTCLANETTILEDAYGSDHLHILEDWRSLFDANPDWPIAWKTDAPILSFNTIDAIYSYATRREVKPDGDVCLPPDWLKAHAIEVAEILPMMTYNAAYVLHREDQVGSLEIGKSADLIVLSDNPLAVSKNDLHELEILMTMASGEIVYCHPDYMDICNDISTKNVEINAASNITISPSPFSSNLIIHSVENSSPLDISMIDLSGRKVLHGSRLTGDTSGRISIDASDLRSGVYFVRIESDGSIEYQKVIKI